MHPIKVCGSAQFLITLYNDVDGRFFGFFCVKKNFIN